MRKLGHRCTVTGPTAWLCVWVKLFLFLQLVKYNPGPPLHGAERHATITRPEGDSISRVAQTCSGQHWWSSYSADFLCHDNSGLPTLIHWIPNDKFRPFICKNGRTYTRLCPLIQKVDQCAACFFAYRQEKREAWCCWGENNGSRLVIFIHFLLLRSHLSERRPFLFLLHVRIIIWVGRVVAGVTVGMEHISCAEFVERSKSNTWSIPETHGAVFMSVNLKKKKRQKKKNMTTEASVSAPAFLKKFHWKKTISWFVLCNFQLNSFLFLQLILVLKQYSSIGVTN